MILDVECELCDVGIGYHDKEGGVEYTQGGECTVCGALVCDEHAYNYKGDLVCEPCCNELLEEEGDE
jgi:hypothetical protein